MKTVLMDITIIRAKLHDYIDVADEQHLSAIYTLVEAYVPTHDDSIYDEATMKMLYERRENHRKGLSKSYSVQESISQVGK